MRYFIIKPELITANSLRAKQKRTPAAPLKVIQDSILFIVCYQQFEPHPHPPNPFPQQQSSSKGHMHPSPPPPPPKNPPPQLSRESHPHPPKPFPQQHSSSSIHKQELLSPPNNPPISGSPFRRFTLLYDNTGILVTDSA